MDRLSEAENRALEGRCHLPTSPASRTAVVKLRALPPDRQTLCIVGYELCDLPHLVRCSLEAVRPSACASCAPPFFAKIHALAALTPVGGSIIRASQPTRAGARATRPCCASPPLTEANVL